MIRIFSSLPFSVMVKSNETVEIFAIREVIHLENSVKCCPLKVGLVRVGITVICFGANKMAVSYTHLTLPTKLEV